MPRRPTPLAFQSAHVTVRCNNKEFLFYLKNNFAHMVSWLNSLPLFFNARIHHALFMSNHIHMLITPQENNLGDAMSYFLSNLTKCLNHNIGRSNHLFGNRYSPVIIESERHFINVIRYLYQNPVRAGISNNAADYPYSTLQDYLGTGRSGIVISTDPFTKSLFNYGFEGREKWIQLISNTLSNDDVSVLRDSLKRSLFRFSTRQIQKLQDTSLVI